MALRALSGPEPVWKRFDNISPTLCRAIAYAGALLVVGPYLYHIARGSKAYLGLLEDDFFYYSIIADNLASLGKLTYDTTTITNGFHPLWFVTLLFVRVLTGGLNNAFYLVLSAIFLGSMIASYELARAFARALGASPALAAATALIPSVATDQLVSTGMETALDVPFILWLLVAVARPLPVTPARAARLGVISSLAVLSRLDIGLVVLLIAVGWLIVARPALEQAFKALLAFSAAGIAVPAYAAFNWLMFGSILPTSAVAKQLVRRFGVSIGYLYSIAFTTPYGRFAGIVLVFGVFAGLALYRRRAYERPQAFFAAALALGFAALYFGLNSLSGWIYFGWYAYPYAPAMVAALTLIGCWFAPRVAASARSRASSFVVACSVALASFQGISYFATHGPLWSVEDNGLLGMSVQLSDRLRDRKGTYAMGAIGGFASYVLDRPMVQLEGLVSDRAMLEHIRAEDDLGRVLQAYGVDYLVVSMHHVKMTQREGCYVVTQPDVEWAGKRTKKMHGEICSPPIVHFINRTPGHSWSIFNVLDTYVFDVRASRWRESKAGAELRLPEHARAW